MTKIQRLASLGGGAVQPGDYWAYYYVFSGDQTKNGILTSSDGISWNRFTTQTGGGPNNYWTLDANKKFLVVSGQFRVIWWYNIDAGTSGTVTIPAGDGFSWSYAAFAGPSNNTTNTKLIFGEGQGTVSYWSGLTSSTIASTITNPSYAPYNPDKNGVWVDYDTNNYRLYLGEKVITVPKASGTGPSSGWGGSGIPAQISSNYIDYAFDSSTKAGVATGGQVWVNAAKGIARYPVYYTSNISTTAFSQSVYDQLMWNPVYHSGQSAFFSIDPNRTAILKSTNGSTWTTYYTSTLGGQLQRILPLQGTNDLLIGTSNSSAGTVGIYRLTSGGSVSSLLTTSGNSTSQRNGVYSLIYRPRT